MNDDGAGILGRQGATAEEVRAAIEHGIFKALSAHKRDGQSIAVWDWEKHRAVLIPPDRIELPAEYEPVPETAELSSTD